MSIWFYKKHGEIIVRMRPPVHGESKPAPIRQRWSMLDVELVTEPSEVERTALNEVEDGTIVVFDDDGNCLGGVLGSDRDGPVIDGTVWGHPSRRGWRRNLPDR